MTSANYWLSNTAQDTIYSRVMCIYSRWTCNLSLTSFNSYFNTSLKKILWCINLSGFNMIQDTHEYSRMLCTVQPNVSKHWITCTHSHYFHRHKRNYLLNKVPNQRAYDFRRIATVFVSVLLNHLLDWFIQNTDDLTA